MSGARVDLEPKWFRRPPVWPLALAPLPALAVGDALMRGVGAPTGRWAIDLVAAAVGLVAFGALMRVRRPERWSTRAFVLAAVALGMTFLAPGVAHVHRWIAVGPVAVHVGAIAAPVMVFAAATMSGDATRLQRLGIAVMGPVLMAMQPDAGQATALAVAMGVITTRTFASIAERWLVFVMLMPTIAFAWSRGDPLPPVDDVERPVQLAFAQGPTLGCFSIAALAALLLPFAYARTSRVGEPAGRMALGVGTYTAGTIAMSAIGNFPMPVLGHGASPIVGIYIGLGLLARCADVVDRAANERGPA